VSLESTDDRFYAVVDELLRKYKSDIERKYVEEIEQLKEQVEEMTKERWKWGTQEGTFWKELDLNPLAGFCCT
jgi:hypothetical protein